MSRKVAVLATVLILFSTAARADIIDPIIGVRGGDASTNITTAVGEQLALPGVPCESLEGHEDLAGALCWEYFNDTGQFIYAFSGYFLNPACDGIAENPDCILSLHEDSEFEALQTFPIFLHEETQTWGLPFRFSEGVIPPDFFEIDSFGPLALLSTAHFIVYGFQFDPDLGATLTLTSFETSIPEPATLGLMLLGLGAAARRWRQYRRV